MTKGRDEIRAEFSKPFIGTPTRWMIEVNSSIEMLKLHISEAHKKLDEVEVWTNTLDRQTGALQASIEGELAMRGTSDDT